MLRGVGFYAAAAALAVLATTSLASAGETPGVTSSSILIGGTTPLSGPASAYASVARGADAYFKYVNARGGVHRRTIRYRYLDDRYDPSATIERTRQLVQQDKVFAIFNTLGTETNLAIRSYLNAVDVPHLFVASGASTWGRDYKRYPWTIGYQPTYLAEGTVYGRYIAKTKPRARIGILYQNDDYGRELITGLRRGLGKKARLIVSRQGHDVTDADVGSQIARLKAARVNTFMIFTTPKFAIQAYVYANKLGWRPQVFVNAVSNASNVMGIATAGTNRRTTEGSLSIGVIKDPMDPTWTKDPGMRLYKRIMRRYGRGRVNDFYNVYGMAVAFTMVDTLKKAGRNLTRAGVMRAATRLNERNNPFVHPGVVIRTTPTSRYPLRQAKLQRYRNGRWVSFGGLVTVR